jgi:LSD1 subclass zinc finger protein
MAPATAQEAGRNCPYCRFPLKEGAQAVRCGSCHATHHADCWSDNGGCAVMGCAGAPGSSPTGTATPVPVQPAAGYAAPPPTHTAPALAAPLPTAVTAMSPPASGARGGRWLVAAVLALAVAIAGVAVAIAVRGAESSPPGGSKAQAATLGDQESAPADDPGLEAEADAVEPEPDAPVEADQALEDALDPAPTPAPPSSPLDTMSRPEMRFAIADMLRSHHENIVAGRFRAAWNQLTARKQAQKEREGGYSQWAAAQATLSPYLDPTALDVRIDAVEKRDDVVRVDVRGMGWSKPGSRCTTWSGITWVRYEDGEWRYDPGYSTTTKRRREWEPRQTETMGWGC